MKRPTSTDVASVGRLLTELVEPVLKELVRESVREVLEEEGLTADTGADGGPASSGRSRRGYPVGALVVLLVLLGIGYVVKRNGLGRSPPQS